jgi:hypothetical protein
MRLTTAATFKTYFQEGISQAYDDFTIGDAAVLVTTSAGNITIDAAGNDTDIILKGTDGGADTTFLTIDGSAAGEATFNAGIVIANAGNIGSASDKDAIAIASNGVVTFSQIPVMPANSIDSDEYIDGSIDREHLAADIIDGTKIADDAVDEEHLAASAVVTAAINADAVTGAKIADDAIGEEHLAANAVVTAAINADAVTGAKIADDAINSEHYTDGSIDTVHIADDQITAAKTDTATNGTVEVNKIVTTDGDGTVTFPDSAKARFGNGADLQIYHDGTNNYIYGNSGELRIQIAGGENAIKIVNEGQVELYRDNVKRFETSELGNTAHGILLASRGIENYATDAATSVSTATVQIKTHGGDSTLTNFGGNSGGGGYIQRTNSNGGAVYPIHLNPYGGNVVIGATASILSSIGRLSSYADASAPFLLSQNSGTGGTNYFARMYANNTNAIGSINCTNTATVFNTSSDYRLKENVNYTWDATTRLKQLKPARFNFIVDDTNTLVDGFLAHEVSSIVPESITGDKDEVDEDGNPEFQGIDQSKLVPLLVKTIQELEARITALEDA